MFLHSFSVPRLIEITHPWLPNLALSTFEFSVVGKKIIFSWEDKILKNLIIPKGNPKTDPQYNVIKVQLGETISFYLCY